MANTIAQDKKEATQNDREADAYARELEGIRAQLARAAGALRARNRQVAHDIVDSALAKLANIRASH
jgi:hypothetical protein